MARYESYVDSIVERDVAPVAPIRKPDTPRRLIQQLAHRTAEELEVAKLCAALGARQETVSAYLDALSRPGIVHRLGAWTASGARKEVRLPKLHFMDTGCATALRGEDSHSFGLRADPAALEALSLASRSPGSRHRGSGARSLALFEVKASTTVGSTRP